MRRSRSVPVAIITFALSAAAATHASGETPEPSSDGAAAMGRATFRVYCGSCHGRYGRGDGSVAEHLKVPPADLTRIAANNDGEFPAQRVREIIDGREKTRGHGDRDMPVWGDAFLKTASVEDDAGVRQKIDDLVAYLATIQED